MRTILVAASLASCAVGCSTAAPPEPSAAPPQPSAAPAAEVLERSATVVHAMAFDDSWTYHLAHDDDAPTVAGYVTVRTAGGEVFEARLSRPRKFAAEHFAPQAPDREIAVLDSLPGGDPLPALEIGERLKYGPLENVPNFRAPKPRRGASDVPPFGR